MRKNCNLKFVARILILFPVLFFLLSTLAVHAFPFREFKEGDSVPDVNLSSLEAGSSALTFSELKGRPYIVVFWGADLPEKKERSAEILGVIEELVPFLEARDVQRYSVDVQNDDNTVISEVVQKAGSSIKVYKDENRKAYGTLGIFVMPAVLLVDRDGNAAAGMGYSHDVADRLKGAVEIMLGEKTAEQVAAELRPEMKDLSEVEKLRQRHYSYGMVMKKRGQFDAAIRELSKAVEVDPDMTEAYLQLGCLYLGKNDLAHAETAINKVLETEPESVKGKTCRGELLRLKGQLAEAADLLQKVISANQENFEAQYYFARVQEDLQKDREAAESFKKAYMSIVQYVAADKE